MSNGHEPADNLRAALRVVVQSQYELYTASAGWLLHAASLASSPLWQAVDAAIDPSLRALADQLRADRAALFDNVLDQLEPMFSQALNDHARRPRAGISARQILSAMYCLVDGAFLRTTIDPAAISVEVVAEALYQLAYAMTEDGSVRDPRRPEDEDRGALFDALLQGALRCWDAGSTTVSVADAAREAGVDPAAAAMLFASPVELADSAVRVLTFAVESYAQPALSAEQTDTQQRVAMSTVTGLLRRVCTVASRDLVPWPNCLAVPPIV